MTKKRSAGSGAKSAHKEDKRGTSSAERAQRGVADENEQNQRDQRNDQLAEEPPAEGGDVDNDDDTSSDEVN